MRIAVVALVVAGCGGAQTAGVTTTAEAPERECTAALRFEEPRESDEDRPRTQVSLVLICQAEPTRRVAVGAEVGACFAIEPEGVLLRARCWWAGEGAVLEVRRDRDDLVVHRAAIDEHAGIAEADEIARLPIPANARVQPL